MHATADGVAVVFHDPTLERLTGQPGRIAALRWADLATVRVGGAAAVPRLDDVLAAWPQVRFNIDVKADGGVVPTVDGGAAGRRRRTGCCWPRSATPGWPGCAPWPARDVATSLGMRAVARLRMASLTGRPAACCRRRWSPRRCPSATAGCRVVDRRFVTYAHRLGLQVHVWTIDDPAEMNDLLDLGVDGIMTDRVDVLRDVYTSRGLWPA